MGNCHLRIVKIPNNFNVRRNPLQLKNLSVVVIHTVVQGYLEKGEGREMGRREEKDGELE